MKTEEILEALRICATHEEKECGLCPQRPFVHCMEQLADEATVLIKGLTDENMDLHREIEWKDMVIVTAQKKQSEAETVRDAALDAIKHLGGCSVCKNMLDCSKNGRHCESLSGLHAYDRWQWRGLPDAPEEGGMV